ncbi:MAG: hypothetical protein KBT85_16045 [Pseudomonas sp.]|jgi:ABC-type phosphate transport system permease subunit|uniref:hypothetical protein n=1 Tax=Halopseudomonas sp. TaxID=2901191 RepID=UPI001B74D554|nr:hypothetical protein [Pseudomonas sp.]
MADSSRLSADSRVPTDQATKLLIGGPALLAALLLLLVVAFVAYEAWPVMAGANGVSLLDFFNSDGDRVCAVRPRRTGLVAMVGGAGFFRCADTG